MNSSATTIASVENESSAGMPAPDLSSSDLAELMSAFTEVTTKLERTHGQLRSEVGRLNQELRQANEALQRSRRLAALGEMAAGISHEIRNPLGSIRLYANMLGDDLKGMPEQCEIVDKIGRAVRGLDEIVGDVLAFAREMKTHWQPCDVSELIDHSIELCLAELDGSVVVRLDVESGAQESRELMCDVTLLGQALVNIIRNAGQANSSAGGGRLEIDVALGEIEEEDHLVKCFKISVSDQGGGIPGDVIDRMFNPFFTTRAAGTGLGLAIVHRIVDAHHGKIVVSNIAADDQSDDQSEDSPSGVSDENRVVGARVEIYVPLEQSVVVVPRQPVPCRAQIVVKPRRLSASL